MAKRASKTVAAEPAIVTPEAQPAAAAAEPVAPVADAPTENTDMPCVTCGGVVINDAPPPPITEAAQASAPEQPAPDTVLMKFTGAQSGPVTYFGLYAGCATCAPVWVNPGDVERMELTGVWVRVVSEAQP